MSIASKIISSPANNNANSEEIGTIFSELQTTRARELALELENNELRRSLRKSTSEVALSREYELLCQDRRRMSQLVEQLKLEKEHLIETVVNLSNDVDEAHRTRFDDNLKYKQEALRHVEDEKNSRRLTYQMGMGIVDILKVNGIDMLIVQEVQMHITNTSFLPVSPQPIGPDGAQIDSFNAISAVHTPANLFHDDLNHHQSYDSRSLYGANNGAGGPTSRRRRHRRLRLERDEEGSDISSVSTHRSGRVASSERSPARSKGGGNAVKADVIAANDSILRDARRGNVVENKQPDAPCTIS